MEKNHPASHAPYPEAGSCERFLRLLRPHVPEGLIPASVWQRMASTLKALPGTLAMNRFIIEIPLGCQWEPVDFSVLLVREAMGPEILSSASRRSDAAADPAWQACGRIASAWGDPETVLGSCVKDIWLEFDLFSARPVCPSIFFRVMDHDVHRFRKIHENVRSCIGQGVVCEGTDSTILGCLASLDEGRRITWFGAMLPRPEGGFRLCVHFPENRVSQFLHASGYPFPTDPISQLFDRLNTVFHAVSLNIDVGETLGETVGFECFFPREYDWIAPSCRVHALDSLVEQGWCTPEKRAAVLSFGGRTRFGDAPGDWPEELLAFCEKDRSGMESVFIRRMSHLKVRYRPEEDPVAKVYLLAAHRWGKTSASTDL